MIFGWGEGDETWCLLYYELFVTNTSLVVQSENKSKDNKGYEITTKNTKHDLKTPFLTFIPIKSLGGSLKFVYVFEFLPPESLRRDLFHY